MKKVKMPKIDDLFDAGVHFGHQVKRWHPNMEPYIFSVRKNIHIINLENTLSGLEEACSFMYEKAKAGEQVVFVGTKRQSKEIIESEAKRCGAKYVTERWLGGTITNFGVIKKNIDKLVDMMKKREEGEYQKYTKKERLMIDREIEKLQLSVGGIVGLNSKPGAVFVVDTKREKTAVKEAKIADIPVIALIDTNSDPTIIDYPIPGNDDAIKSIAIIVKTIADAVEQGYKDHDPKRTKKEKKVEKPEATEEEGPVERKVIKVTSDAEELVVDEDLSDKEDLEKISEEEAGKETIDGSDQQASENEQKDEKDTKKKEDKKTVEKDKSVKDKEEKRKKISKKVEKKESPSEDVEKGSKDKEDNSEAEEKEKSNGKELKKKE